MGLTMRKRLGIGVAAAALTAGVFGVPAAGASTVVVGSQLTNPATFAPDALLAPSTRTNFVLPSPATGVSPVTGTIRSWKFIGTGGPFVPTVLRATGGFSLTGAGQGPPVNASGPGAVSGPFTISLPIKTGEFFGVDVAATPTALHRAPNPTATYFDFVPPLTNGGAGKAPTTVANGELGIQATVTYCTVPKLKGKTGKAARQTLTGADCTVGDVDKAKKRTPVKKVLTQDPKAGNQIADTEPVDFRISRKKK